MIDIHTHILPEIDDGSKSLENSIEQVKFMAKNGVTDIVCTPHFIRNYWHNTAEIISEKFKQLQKAVKDENIKLHQGCEVYLDENSLQTIQNQKLNIGNTNYVLVETMMTEFPVNLFDILYQLVKANFKPILAHPERYLPIIANFELAENFMFRDIYLQVNAGSLFGKYGKKSQKTAFKMIDYGFAHFVASDNHCRNFHYPLPAAFEVISNQCDEYTANLLTQVNPAKMLQNENIPIFYLEK